MPSSVLIIQIYIFTLLDDNDILLENSCNPDLNLFSENIKNLGTTQLLPSKFHYFLDKSVTHWFPN